MKKEDRPAAILVIDDEESVLESLSLILEGFGYSVQKAGNGKIGLHIIAESRPDVVLLDLSMPEMNGFEVLKRIKERDPDQPVIVVSASGKSSDIVKAIRLGAWDYIIKPVEDLSILGYTVEKTLEKDRLRRENVLYREYLEKLVRDRTEELEKSNAELKSALKEREILLREIHHRVKNNLQIIVSILSLQQERAKDAFLEEELKVTLNRARSMAVVHDLLYQARNLERIDFADLVDRLVANIEGTYSAMERFKIEKTLAGYEPPMDRAVPLSMILNELLTNSFRHSHPEGGEGKILIEGTTTESGGYEIRLEDDGVGLNGTEGSHLEEGVGFRVVSGLVKQLGGELRFDCRGKGSSVVIILPPEEERD